MDIIKYFDETIRLDKELTEARQKYERLIDEYHDVRKVCTHDIVFKFVDNQPRKTNLDGYYFCPACSLVIECTQKEQLLKTKYKNSRIIELPNLFLRNGKIVHHAIRQEVYDNIDLYYNTNISKEALSEKMESVLEPHHFDYLNPNKVLKKEK